MLQGGPGLNGADYWFCRVESGARLDGEEWFIEHYRCFVAKYGMEPDEAMVSIRFKLGSVSISFGKKDEDATCRERRAMVVWPPVLSDFYLRSDFDEEMASMRADLGELSGPKDSCRVCRSTSQDKESDHERNTQKQG